MVVGSGSDVLVLFDQPVTVVTGVTYDTAFTASGAGVVNVTPVSGTVLRVQLFSFVLAGSPWTLSAQPNWLATPVQSPAGGTLM